MNGNHVNYIPRKGYTEIVSDDGLLPGFGLLRLARDDTFSRKEEGSETALVLLSGQCAVHCAANAFTLGPRKDVFTDKPYAAYIPRGLPYTVTASGAAELAICTASTGFEGEPQLIGPEDVSCRTVGKEHWDRKVCDIIGPGFAGGRLILGETFNPPGNWSSYPPHKHDVDNPPVETRMGEVYYFKVRPENGFGLQRVYSKVGSRQDCAYVIKNDDVVSIPEGYHPVAAAPGYDVYYLWVLAGDKRILRPHDDPDHAWIKG